ncbi:MAG: 4-alpha-glucanotransferase [Prevotella sp.]|nr:4-alpha-glucanotransferase [Prevotella sp.]
MNLNFHISYQTTFGEEVVLNVVCNKGAAHESIVKYPMTTLDGMHWTCSLGALPKSSASTVHYFYSIERAGSTIHAEWQLQLHRLEWSDEKSYSYTTYDQWHAVPEDAYQYSSAFTDCMKRRSLARFVAGSAKKSLRLVVFAPQLREGQYLYLVGSHVLLGAWNTDKALAMTEQNYNEWIIDLDLEQLACTHIEFKFVAKTPSNEVIWETGYNRHVELPVIKDAGVVTYELSQAFFPLNNERVAGTLIPVFSLRSKGSFGVGDFGDLKQMIDFVAATRQRVLQVLPINDTTTTHTWTDSYPYSCISIFAIHPQYVDFRQLPALNDAAEKKQFEQLRAELNALPQIDYERVNDAKIAYLKALYAQEGSQVLKSDAFKVFFEEEGKWLVPYAQYCYLRDLYGTADFNSWKSHKVWNENDRKSLSSPTAKAYKDVAFYYYVQFVLSVQMQSAHEYAKAQGVILKGDIPIGVSRYGCDVWMEPHYFNMNGQAGAPPDDFSVNGQNWGFPTYNWDEMLKDGCAWWVRRFQNMSKFFDAYRIDHVLGFFRIWEIPIDSVHGLLGQFSPSLGMTREEIEAYGLHFQEKQFTRPFIADWLLERVFREHTGLVKEKYLVHEHDDIYRMHPDYDTQRKVEAAFEGKTSEVDVWIRDGLYSLISDVLFVRDRKEPHKFHPRISVQHDFVYEALYDCDKEAFNRLYNDYYYRRNNQYWYYEAMKKLPKLVEATRMLVCAEDLGMVPDCVDWVMKQLRILSLEVQSMPKDPSVKFGQPSGYPYRSVNTLSSHDMPTLRQWWDEDIDRSQEYYNSMLYRGGAAPHPMPGWLAEDIIMRQLESPSMLCVLSLQDWFAIDENLRLQDQNAERINIPANPKHYWRYRMHVNIDDLLVDNPFADKLRNMIQQSGRN